MVLIPIAGILLASCGAGEPVALPVSAVQNAPTSFVPNLPVAGSSAAVTPAPGFLGSEPAAQGADAAEGTSTADERQTYTVQRGTVVDEIKLSGQVAPVQQSLAFAQEGVLEVLYVQPGAAVEQGQLLAELDIGELEEQLRQAQVVYEQDQLALERSVEAARLNVERARLDLQAAEAEVERLQSPASGAELTAAQLALRQAQAQLELTRNNASAEKNRAKEARDSALGDLVVAQQQFDEARRLFERRQGSDEASRDYDAAGERLRRAEGAVKLAQIAYDTALGNEVAQVQSAEAVVDSARATLDRLLSGPDTHELADARRAVERARVALREAEQATQPAPQLTMAVATSESQLRRLQAQIDARRLYAPFAGVVGAVAANPGFPVRIASPVITIVDPSSTEILASSAAQRESARIDAERLTVGQEVTVSFSRYSGRTFSGTITQVPNRQTDGGLSNLSYHIGFDAPGAELDIGDSAELLVTLGRKYNTLWLPPQAVRLTDSPFVLVRDGERERRVNVQVGIVSAERVEILAGLSENDGVLGQ
jgi:multidrug efflux pump subunit AcrA (membrane-fusion protein)